MERENGQVVEVGSVAAIVAVPITMDAVDDGTQIQLGAEYVKHQVAVDARGRKRGLVYLEGMGAFGRLHR